MPMLTLGEAAKACGVPKSTVSRAIKAGRISAGRNDLGQYSIDPAELFRVYPVKSETVADTPATPVAAQPVVQDATESDATTLRVRNAQLAEQINGLHALLNVERERTEREKQRVDEMRQRADELKSERDKWAAQAERLALTGPKSVTRWWPWKRQA